MSDTKLPKTPDSQANENEDKKVDVPVKANETDENWFRDWILENDIRVIFWGEHHYSEYTCLEFDKFKKCSDILKAVYLEACNEELTPATESQARRKYLTDLISVKDASGYDIYEKVASHLETLNATDKLQAFGCQNHRYTRETLEKAIAETEKGKLTIIMIGSYHLSAITDPLFIYDKFQGPPIDREEEAEDGAIQDQQDETKADDTTVTYQSAEEALKAMELFPEKVTEYGNKNLVKSYGLIDYYAEKFDIGMLVVDSSWRNEQMIDYEKGRQKHSLLVNQSVRNLMSRLDDKKNIYITINTREWDNAYRNILKEKRQNSLFKEFDDGLSKSVSRFIYDHLYGGVHKELSKEFLEKYGWHYSFRLYFTSLTPAIPGAEDPIKAIDWKELEKTDVIDEGHYEDPYESYEDDGDDFDEEEASELCDFNSDTQ